MYEINPGIPIPKYTKRGKYPFHDMNVGDSFFVPDKTITQINAAIQSYKRRHKGTFSVRRADGGVRVWRTS